MGFMGLKHWVEVDGASDLHSEIGNHLNKLVTKHLKDPGNDYNPPGFVNVALIVKDSPDLKWFFSDKLINKISKAFANYDEHNFSGDTRREFVSLRNFWRRTF